jgi:hypothetical protein
MKRILSVGKFGFAILALSMAVMVTGCKKKKKVQETPDPKGEVVINEYCTGPEYFTDKKHFRASATGESLDRETAKKKARSNAEQELARSINATIKVVADNYVNSTEFNNREEATETFQQLGRTVVDQKLSGAVKICDKLTQKDDGRYVSYVAIELSGDELISDYNESLSRDERVQAEYNYQQFKEVFEQEMEKLGSGN